MSKIPPKWFYGKVNTLYEQFYHSQIAKECVLVAKISNHERI